MGCHMNRVVACLMTLGVVLGFAPAAFAQVYVRAPFVRVQVGGGVYVRAPFVSLYVPTGPRYYFLPSEPPSSSFSPPTPMLEELPRPALTPPMPKARSAVPERLDLGEKTPTPPPPKPKSPPPPQPDLREPAPVQPERPPTLQEFAKSFQPKAGNYELTLLNPVTQQPTVVRFTLPDGTPRRVNASERQIEFDYGPRKYVRLHFDRDGVEVTTR